MRKLLATVITGVALVASLAPAANAKRPQVKPIETDPVPCICLPSPTDA